MHMCACVCVDMFLWMMFSYMASIQSPVEYTLQAEEVPTTMEVLVVPFPCERCSVSKALFKFSVADCRRARDSWCALTENNSL